MLKIGRIIGLPLKIFANNQIYIPKEYLSYYGISSKYEKVSVKLSDKSIFITKAQPACTFLRPVRNGLIRLPSVWVNRHQLRKDDFLFLLGTSTGLLIYTK